MRFEIGSRVPARGWRTALWISLACGVAIGAGPWGGERDDRDAWTGFVEAGDRGGPRLDSPATRARPPLTARQAYLLAFHQAQDAGDPEHVLAVADRLAGIGEDALARHVRWAAGLLLEDLGFALDVAGNRPIP